MQDGKEKGKVQNLLAEKELQRLKDVTEEYWNYDASIDDRIERYICQEEDELGGQSLLKAELEAAKGRIRVPHCNTLVLLVGYSLEPLLQAVCAYTPRKVILLLNEKPYQMGKGKKPKKWHAYVRHLTDATALLKQQKLLTEIPEFPGQDGKTGYSVADNPRAVFQKLVEVLKDEDDVVIDVTGGKKSMVSGAYLYAAYAGTRISYVDFDEYDPEYRRPYGYSCKISGVSNPYEAFALHEWERVRDLYSRYQFREARSLLVGNDDRQTNNTIITPMQRYLPDSTPYIQKLARVFRCYELWDAGLYNEAAEKAKEIRKEVPDFTPPTAVGLLGGKWFATAPARFQGGLYNFYEDTPEFQAYVIDELERIRRLIKKEDYRSAFLRAGSLNEIVMLARLVRMVESNAQRKRLLEALQRKTPNAQAVFEQLKRPRGHTFRIGPPGGKERYEISFPGAPVVSITVKKAMNWWRNIPLFDGQGSWKQFIHLRNDLAHKYYSPPRPWAEDALAFVQANVEDFWGQSIDTIGMQTQAIPWSTLCKLTGIAPFLPPNLRKEA